MLVPTQYTMHGSRVLDVHQFLFRLDWPLFRPEAALLTAMLLKRCRLARFFYHAPLILVVTCVLSLGLGESVWAITMHKGQTGHMDTDAKDKAKTPKDKVKATSLIEQAPIVIDINRRYYKFYGQPYETVVGGVLERSQLTNNWNGGRDKLTEAGVEK